MTAMGDLDEKLAHAEERAMEAEAKRGEALDRCAEAAERAEIMEARERTHAKVLASLAGSEAHPAAQRRMFRVAVSSSCGVYACPLC